MGLDATVYCDCYETGKFRESPPFGLQLEVGEEGGIYPQDDPDLDKIIACDRWMRDCCEHEEQVLVHHRIGNFSRVGLLRGELSRTPDHFPILLGKVVYNGMHSGDWLALEEALSLGAELDRLATFVGRTSEATEAVRYFYRQMSELRNASLSVQKPISF